MSAELQSIFRDLKAILRRTAPGLPVSRDSAGRYALEASPGPATLRAWGGQRRRPRIAVAWVEIQEGYVGYHLMSLGHAKARTTLSTQLEARRQGKSCFHFGARDEALFRELEQVTARSLAAFREAGFIADRDPP